MIQCPKCDKAFNNEMGVRMHDMRVHTKKIQVPREGTGWKAARNARNAALLPAVPGRNLKHPELEPIYQQIVDRYTDENGMIRWARAMKENPDWKKALRHVPPGTKYARTYSIKKRQLKEAQRNGAQEVPAADQPAVKVRRNKGTARFMQQGGGHGLDECPRCKLDLAEWAMWNHVANVVKGLKGQH